MGDLKLVERPQNYSLAPATSMQIKANIKVSSTETGVIFGNIVYETSNVMERNVVVLNDIHIDIMDYISPAVCSDVAFRTCGQSLNGKTRSHTKTFLHFVLSLVFNHLRCGLHVRLL